MCLVARFQEGDVVPESEIEQEDLELQLVAEAIGYVAKMDTPEIERYMKGTWRNCGVCWRGHGRNDFAVPSEFLSARAFNVTTQCPFSNTGLRRNFKGCFSYSSFSFHN